VPDDAWVIFSAHGVSQAVQQEAKDRGLQVFDATCPLVTKVHMEVMTYSREGRECILIGHAGHPEVEGTMGQYDRSNGGDIYLVEDENDALNLEVKNPDKLAFVTQTTLSMDDTARVIDALQNRFPHRGAAQGRYLLRHPEPPGRGEDACCRMRPDAGGGARPTAPIQTCLRELAERMGTPGYLIDSAEQIEADWLEGVNSVGVTAGASAPEVLVEEVVSRLREFGGQTPDEVEGREENVVFSMPRALRIPVQELES